MAGIVAMVACACRIALLQNCSKVLLPCLFSHNIILHWGLDEQTICPDLETEPQALAQKHVQYFWYLWYVVRVVSGIRGTWCAWYVVCVVRDTCGMWYVCLFAHNIMSQMSEPPVQTIETEPKTLT